MKAPLLLVFLALGSSGCTLIKGAPHVDVALDVASQYSLRGAVQVDNPVVQPSASARVPISETTGLGASVWANANVEDDAGDAFLPDGNGQAISEVDFTGAYYQELGGVEYIFGLINYSFPTSTLITPSRTDAFAAAEWTANGWGNAFAAYYALNDFGGLYVRADFNRGWVVNKKTDFDLSAGMGFSDEDNSLLYYGIAESGLSDLSITGSLSYKFDPRTTAAIYVTATQLVDSTLADSVEALGIEPDNFLIGISMSWAY
jgi:hypothetical protein